MKRLMFPAPVAVAAAIALFASTVASGVPGQDSVVGTGERIALGGMPVTVHVNATSGPAGEDARGTFWVMRGAPPETRFRGRITCLAVEGNRAAARGIVEESTAPTNPVGSEFQIQITDNGPPGSAADTNINLFGFAPGEGCPDFFAFSEIPLDNGNFEVTDS
jgi:hypothetical protein